MVKTVFNHHIYTRNICKNRQLKSSQVAQIYLLRLNENPHWLTKEIIQEVQKDFEINLKK